MSVCVVVALGTWGCMSERKEVFKLKFPVTLFLQCRHVSLIEFLIMVKFKA